MPNIDLQLGSFGVGVVDYTLKHRVYGTSTFLTTNAIPTNPIPATNITPQIIGVIDNTIYEIQITSNCGSSVANSSIVRKIKRGCPTLAQHNISVTDTTITSSFPLATPAPISNHISNITVELYQGLTLVNSQIISAPNTINTVTFTGLNQNTTYTLKYKVNFTAPDSLPLLTYPNGGTDSMMVCNTTAQTNVTPLCPSGIILSISES